MEWQNIKTMPMNKLVLVSDSVLVRPGTRIEEDVVAAPFLQNIGFWTHWMPLPPPPSDKDDKG